MYKEEKTHGLSDEMRKACIGERSDQKSEMEELIIFLRDQTNRYQYFLKSLSLYCDRLHPMRAIEENDYSDPDRTNGAINVILHEAKRIKDNNDRLEMIVNHMHNVIG